MLTDKTQYRYSLDFDTLPNIVKKLRFFNRPIKGERTQCNRPSIDQSKASKPNAINHQLTNQRRANPIQVKEIKSKRARLFLT